MCVAQCVYVCLDVIVCAHRPRFVCLGYGLVTQLGQDRHEHAVRVDGEYSSGDVREQNCIMPVLLVISVRRGDKDGIGFRA